MAPTTRRHPIPVPESIDGGRAGIALPSAMFALVAASILAAGVFASADLSAKATLNQERATRAMHVADAGISHVLSLLRGQLRMHSLTRILRGSDNAVPTADDRRLTNVAGSGYNLPTNDQIPAAGATFQGSTYVITITDDPMDGDASAATDLNGRLLVRCQVTTPDGASADITAVVGAMPFPGVATDGHATYSGTPNILGACGSAHANGNINGTGTPTVALQATATGTAGGNFKLPNGTNAPEVGGQVEVPIPDLAPLDHCVGADYRLRADGFVVPAATGIAEDANGVEKYGWKRSSSAPVVYTLTSALAVPGTFCVEGNAVIAGVVGTAGAPLRMSVIATGSIDISGNPFIRADHDDNILLLAGGDLSISGNPTAGTDNFSGMVYAGAQCKTSGNFTVFGQLLCANGAQPAGSVNHTTLHDMSGNWTINFDCSATVFNRRRVLFWYPRVGV